ncbi:uncharacterized protein FTOL_13635 [Fusarium torulosum]|uniref:Fungal N-terminal domain-containing protein n=1 Tax=Fusarium torulosum TaxID=33205 RepID=A0AAE8SQE6_9HYPO|nr:uncharacterized protein FTOL_13635 [Fusarium torulosum]
MADPLSVAGLAFAVVSLGFQVTGGITDYFDALNSRDQDIASAKQQNDTLQKTLQVIESSISRLQRDHRAATAALRECLDSCKKELQALESIMAELVACDRATSSRRNNIRNQGKRLLYPFNRPKLEQIATRLHHINATLQLALQSLGLSVSQLGNEKLATLEVTSHTISTSLLNVQSEVSAMHSPLQGLHNTLSQFEARFDGLENLFNQLLVQDSATNGTARETTSSMVTRRLLSKPGFLQEMCDAAGAQAGHRPNGTPPVMHHGTSQLSRTVSMYTGGRFSCLCRRSQQLQRKNAVWGSFSLSRETTTEQHLPGCPATQIIPVTDRRQKVSLTYVGLQYLLNSAIQLSFMVRSGAGGWSFGSTFTYYPLVDSESAPAFRMLFLLIRSRCYLNDGFTNDGLLGDVAWQEKLIPSVVSAVLRLFRANKASPRAVDANNRSLVYNVAECVYLTNDMFDPLPSQADFSPLLDLLQYLLVNKAPANDYDTSGRTPLTRMFSPLTYGSVTDPLPTTSGEMILRSNTEDSVACLSDLDPLAYRTIPCPSGRMIYGQSQAIILYFLGCSAKLAEAYGCGPLSLAILSNDLEKVEQLVRKHPATLAERDLFGHTPLHLAADKPSCLRLLVEVADVKLLNQVDGRDEYGMSALETAVSLSKMHCSEDSRMCRRCKCAECAVILLKADCALPVLTNLELKQFALDNLPITEVERLDLASERVLDSHASEVTQLLQDSGIAVPAALAVVRSEPLPVYQALHSPVDAELFFRIGFRDTDSWWTTDMAELERIPGQGLSYLHWLTKHGGISCQISFPSVRDTFTTHLIFWLIGSEVQPYWPGNSLPPAIDERIAWIHGLHTAVMPANITDACRCKCSPGGCTPITSLLKGAIKYQDFTYQRRHSREVSVQEDGDDLKSNTVDSTDFSHDNATDDRNSLLELIPGFILYLEHFWCHLEVRHHVKALRYITYTAFGIRHSCCHPHSSYVMAEDEGEDEEYKLELLEELLREFEEELIVILQGPDLGATNLTDFWQRTWVGRMSEVLGRLEGSDLPDDERRRAEEVGVIWDKPRPEPPGVIGNPYRSTMLEFWMYELEKIEAECY